jgi:hypothetical protein
MKEFEVKCNKGRRRRAQSILHSYEYSDLFYKPSTTQTKPEHPSTHSNTQSFDVPAAREIQNIETKFESGCLSRSERGLWGQLQFLSAKPYLMPISNCCYCPCSVSWCCCQLERLWIRRTSCFVLSSVVFLLLCCGSSKIENLRMQILWVVGRRIMRSIIASCTYAIRGECFYERHRDTVLFNQRSWNFVTISKGCP